MRLQLVITQFEQRTSPIVNQTDHTIEIYRQTAVISLICLTGGWLQCRFSLRDRISDTKHIGLALQLAGQWHRPAGSATVLYAHVVHFHCSWSIRALCNRPVLTN